VTPPSNANSPSPHYLCPSARWHASIRVTQANRPIGTMVAAAMLLGLLPSIPSFGEQHIRGAEERHERSEPHMGTEFRVICYSSDRELTERAMGDAFRRIAELDERLSDYQSASELSQLSLSSPHDEWRDVGPDLWNVLVESQRVSQRSGGAFDVTLGPLTRVWRRARRRREPPPLELIQEARNVVGYANIQLRDRFESNASRQVRLLRADMRLDLGGIAKGYATEEALRVLQRWGIERALVDGGGDLTVGAAPPGETGWRIGIAPWEANAPPSRFVRLQHRSIATSGDFWQAIEIDGKRYSHILDPRTGWGIERRSTVTVIARRGSLADALASAVSVLGPEAGMQLIRHWDDVELLVLVDESAEGDANEASPRASPLPDPPGTEPALRRNVGRGLVEWSTAGFARYLEEVRDGSPSEP
jgi:FAD:protein FMN transferase